MLRLILIFSCAIVLVAHSNEAVMVDLNKPDTYRALFDAGLRPRKGFRESIDGLLEIRPSKEIGFRVGEKQIPAVKAIWSFDVADNDQINVVRGVVADAWTKAEAFEKTHALESSLGGDVTALKRWIDSYPSSSETGDLWGRSWRSADGTRSIKYYFRHTMQDARPLTISVSIELHWPGRKRGFRKTPLKPPAGYEHVNISFDETYGGSATMTHSSGLKPTAALPENRFPPEARRTASGQPNGELTSSTPWGIIAVSCVAATGLLWLLLHRRAK